MGGLAPRPGLQESSPQGLFIVQYGRVKRSNRFLTKRCGYRPEEVMDTFFASFFHPESIPRVESICEGRGACGQNAMAVSKAVLVCKDGRTCEVRLQASRCRFLGQPSVLVAVSEAGDGEPASLPESGCIHPQGIHPGTGLPASAPGPRQCA